MNSSIGSEGGTELSSAAIFTGEDEDSENSTVSDGEEVATMAEIQSADAVTAPLPPTDMQHQDLVLNIREILIEFYQRHNPEKIGDIDKILETYKGNEMQLLENLQEKYKAKIREPDSGPSKLGATETTTVTESQVKGDDRLESGDKNGNASLIMGMQVAERFLVGWGLGNGQVGPVQQGSGVATKNVSGSSKVGQPAPVGSKGGHTTSSSHDAAVKSPLERLKAENSALESEKVSLLASLKKTKAQIAALSQTNSKLSKDNGDMAVHMESLQRNLVAVVEREAHALSDKQSLAEQLKASEKSCLELRKLLEQAQLRRDNKHALLNDTIALNHRLGAQVRFLAARAMEQHQGFNPRGSRGEIVSFDECNSELDRVLDDAIQRVTKSPLGTGSTATIGGGTKDTVTAGGAVEVELRGDVAARRDNGEGLGESDSSGLAGRAVDLAGDEVVDGDAGNSRRFGDDYGRAGSMTDIQVVRQSRQGVGGGEQGEVTEDWPTIVRVLRARVAGLQSSILASRVELRLALKQASLAEQRVTEQQSIIDGLQKRLSNISHDLETASGSADILRRQVTETSAELSRHKTLLQAAEKNEAERSSRVEEMEREMFLLRENLAASQTAREDLSSLFAEHAKRSESRALEYVNGLMERLMVEREDKMTRLHTVYSMERDVRVVMSQEAQQEQQRLREDLFRSRRAEAQKDREAAFLQRQLGESAGRIAALSQEVAEKEYLQRQLQECKAQAKMHQQQEVEWQQQMAQMRAGVSSGGGGAGGGVSSGGGAGGGSSGGMAGSHSHTGKTR